jgi:hypothetical protein
VELKFLHPAAVFTEAGHRLASLQDRAIRLVPARFIEEGQFARAIARIVRIRRPDIKTLTGDEASLRELRSHGGIELSQFDIYYASTPHGGGWVIDLDRVYRSRSIDHGTDPIRNLFHIQTVPSGSGFRLRIDPHVDENFGLDLLSTYFDMYDSLLDTGIPVEVSQDVVAVATGTQIVRIRRDDPRLTRADLDLPDLETAISVPLTTGERSLPPLADFLRDPTPFFKPSGY